MSLRELVVRALPLEVRGIAFTDPELTIFGDGWGLSLMCPWVLKGPEIASSWGSQTAEAGVAKLIGHQLTSITAGPDVLDPILHFSGDIDLEIAADTDLDPWVLGLPGLVVVGTQPPRDDLGTSPS